MRICLRWSMQVLVRRCVRVRETADDESGSTRRTPLQFQLDADHRQLDDSQLQDRQGGQSEHTDQLSSGSARLLLHFRAARRIALRFRRGVNWEDRIQPQARTGNPLRLLLYVNCPADLPFNARAGPFAAVERDATSASPQR